MPGFQGERGHPGAPGQDGGEGPHGAPGMQGAEGDFGDPGLKGPRVSFEMLCSNFFFEMILISSWPNRFRSPFPLTLFTRQFKGIQLCYFNIGNFKNHN